MPPPTSHTLKTQQSSVIHLMGLVDFPTGQGIAGHPLSLDRQVLWMMMFILSIHFDEWYFSQAAGIIHPTNITEFLTLV